MLPGAGLKPADCAHRFAPNPPAAVAWQCRRRRRGAKRLHLVPATSPTLRHHRAMLTEGVRRPTLRFIHPASRTPCGRRGDDEPRPAPCFDSRATSTVTPLMTTRLTPLTAAPIFTAFVALNAGQRQLNRTFCNCWAPSPSTARRDAHFHFHESKMSHFDVHHDGCRFVGGLQSSPTAVYRGWFDCADKLRTVVNLGARRLRQNADDDGTGR